MSLRNINIKDTYSSNSKASNLILDFYNPVIGQAVSYDRITGYFSPTVLAVAARGFAGLIGTGGKIRLITSVQLDDRTYDSIVKAGANLGEESLPDFDPRTIKSEIDKDYLTVFAWLYRTGQLEMKVAITSKERTMLHQKIGIVTDTEGNSISFSGSNNETPHGWIHNIEQFKVFKSWNPYTTSFFESDKEEFDVLWNDLSNKAKVLDIGDAIKDKLIQKMGHENRGDINTVVKRIRKEEHTNSLRFSPVRGRDAHFLDTSSYGTEASADRDDTPIDKSLDDILQRVNKKPLREYQKQAIDHWKYNNYRGVFEMATGTGKTVTSINALKQLREQKGKLHAVILVPLVTLAEQWKQDVIDILDNVTVIIASSANNDWRDRFNNLVNARRFNIDSDYVIVTTYSSFSSTKFTDLISELPDDDITLVGDEMHNIVTEANLRGLDNPKYHFRLGLSATPTRLWKPDESEEALSLFGTNTYRYGLDKALEKGFLVPYSYHIHRAYLTEEEYEEYAALSKEISQLSQMGGSTNKGNSAYQHKLIQRARIKKQAANKLIVVNELVATLRKSGNFKDTLIYVDSETHLSEMQKILTQQHIKTTKFTGSETLAQRLETISNLRSHKIDAIVAIKCLDEGVDIPSAHTALFLANNTDPREYVQRLGRVLRLDPSGNKKSANIHDFLVLPPLSSDRGTTISRNLVANEFKRAFFFKKLCYNTTDVDIQLGSIMDEYGYYISEEEITESTEEQQ